MGISSQTGSVIVMMMIIAVVISLLLLIGVRLHTEGMDTLRLLSALQQQQRRVQTVLRSIHSMATLNRCKVLDFEDEPSLPCQRDGIRYGIRVLQQQCCYAVRPLFLPRCLLYQELILHDQGLWVHVTEMREKEDHTACASRQVTASRAGRLSLRVVRDSV